MKKNSAFSLIELSVVIVIISFLIAGVAQSSKLIRKSALASAQSQTKQSVVKDLPDLVLWYESTLGSSFISGEITDGGKISMWKDNNPQALSKINSTQATATLRPSYIEKGINGIPSLKFASNYMPVANNPCTQSFTLFVVLQTAVVAGTSYNGAPILWSDVVGAANDITPLIISGSNAAMFNGGASDFWMTASGKSIADNIQHLVAVSRNISDGKRNIWVDGVNYASDSNGSAGTNLNANMGLAIGGNGTYFLNGYIGEIIIFKRVLLDAERKKVEKYLARKWGVAY